jgi:hypothetical protein
MHTKKHIKEFIRLRIDQPKTCQDFEQIHKFFETYMKYMAVTIIRINGGKYQETKSYVSKGWIPCTEEQIRKMILKLFNQKTGNKRYWEQLLKKNKELSICLELLFKYATRVRNLIFHGNYYPFKEGEEALIYDIYIQTIAGLEQMISKQKKGNKILDNSPTDFGAKKGTLARMNQLKNILAFQSAGRPYSYDKAQQLFDQL